MNEVVIRKEENTPHRAWKLALIKELIIAMMGKLCLVKLELPKKHIISRAIDHLYLLENFSIIFFNVLRLNEVTKSDRNLWWGY